MSSITKKSLSNIVGISGAAAATQCSATAPEAQTRLSSASTVANLDTLRISLWVDFDDPKFLEKLEEAK